MNFEPAVAILLPAIALMLWSLVVLVWVGATRLPTMAKLRMHPQKYPRTQDLGAALPAEIQWKADNYNHLMEQPTLFYAAVFAAVLLDAGSGWNLGLAWAYAGLRITHSLVHVTVNKVIVRFYLFVAASFVLAALLVRLLLTFF